MTEKEFTELANKHLVVLESYQLDKDGNKQFNIFGYKQLYEAITVTRCCKSDSEQLKREKCNMCNEEKDCQGHAVCEDCGGRSF